MMASNRCLPSTLCREERAGCKVDRDHHHFNVLARADACHALRRDDPRRDFRSSINRALVNASGRTIGSQQLPVRPRDPCQRQD